MLLKIDRKKKFFSVLLLILASFFISIVPPVWKLRSGPLVIKSQYSQRIFSPDKKDWLDFDDVSRHLINAILVAEDARFYEHLGLDFKEIYYSFRLNLKAKKIIRGASTITQQVVKIAFLTPERSFLRKIREAIGAILLEMILSKDEIFSWYINIVEFGDGIAGVKNAARYYYNSPPDRLTIQEAVHLALVLPNPNSRSKELKQNRLTDFGHRRYFQIVKRMFENGFINKRLMENALASGDFGRPIWPEQRIFSPHLQPKEKVATTTLKTLEPPPPIAFDQAPNLSPFPRK